MSAFISRYAYAVGHVFRTWNSDSQAVRAIESHEKIVLLDPYGERLAYAGTRALLVSHCPVDSEAAVKLTTRAFAELLKEPGIGRAEALRRCMLAVMQDRSNPANAHPLSGHCWWWERVGLM